MAASTQGWSNEDIDRAIHRATSDLGFPVLKALQMEVIKNYLCGKSVFASLPTGFGKSLCYACLPLVYVYLKALSLRTQTSCSIAIVVSPLLSLMADQVAFFKRKGIKSAMISSSINMTSETREKLAKGEFQLVFISPESLLKSKRWRAMIREEPYRSNIIAFVVDEAHCIKQWGEQFHKDFACLDEAKSLLPSGMGVMALTATSTTSSRKQIISILGMKDTCIVSISPIKDNITYFVRKFDSLELCVSDLIEDVKNNGVHAEKTIVFYQKRQLCSLLYLHMKSELGCKFTDRLEEVEGMGILANL